MTLNLEENYVFCKNLITIRVKIAGQNVIWLNPRIKVKAPFEILHSRGVDHQSHMGLIFHLVSCIIICISIRLLARTSTNSSTLPVSESTFQVPTMNAQFIQLISIVLQHCALTHCCAVFWLGFPSPFYIGMWWMIPSFLPCTCYFFWIWLKQRSTNGSSCTGDPTGCQLIWVFSAPSPLILCRMPIPATTLSIYPGLGQTQEYAQTCTHTLDFIWKCSLITACNLVFLCKKLLVVSKHFESDYHNKILH